MKCSTCFLKVAIPMGWIFKCTVCSTFYTFQHAVNVRIPNWLGIQTAGFSSIPFPNPMWSLAINQEFTGIYYVHMYFFLTELENYFNLQIYYSLCLASCIWFGV